MSDNKKMSDNVNRKYYEDTKKNIRKEAEKKASTNGTIRMANVETGKFANFQDSKPELSHFCAKIYWKCKHCNYISYITLGYKSICNQIEEIENNHGILSHAYNYIWNRENVYKFNESHEYCRVVDSKTELTVSISILKQIKTYIEDKYNKEIISKNNF